MARHAARRARCATGTITRSCGQADASGGAGAVRSHPSNVLLRRWGARLVLGAQPTTRARVGYWRWRHSLHDWHCMYLLLHSCHCCCCVCCQLCHCIAAGHAVGGVLIMRAPYLVCECTPVWDAPRPLWHPPRTLWPSAWPPCDNVAHHMQHAVWWLHFLVKQLSSCRALQPARMGSRLHVEPSCPAVATATTAVPYNPHHHNLATGSWRDVVSSQLRLCEVCWAIVSCALLVLRARCVLLTK